MQSKEYRADLISLAENIDTSTPAGRLFYTIFAALAEWERSEIADRVAASVPIRAKLGKPLGGQASFGYRWIGHNLVVDETEAPVRKLMYELFKEHKRKTTVASVLNEQGYRTRNGSKFSDTTIGRLIRDTSAKGERIANYTQSLGENKKWIIKPESEWIRIPCSPIVDAELWSDCNRILDEQESTRKKPGKKPIHLFTGIIYCECNSKMYIPSGSKKYVCPVCKQNRIPADDLEEIYYEHLKTFLITGDHIEAFLKEANGTIGTKENELNSLTQERRRVESEMDKLMSLYMSGEVPKDGFNKYYGPLDEQLKQLDQSIPKVQSEIDFLKIEYLNGDHMLHEAQNLYDRWPGLEQGAKRNIVEQITSQIVLAGEDLKIKFSYNPSLLGIDPDSQHNLRDSWKRPA